MLPATELPGWLDAAAAFTDVACAWEDAWVDTNEPAADVRPLLNCPVAVDGITAWLGFTAPGAGVWSLLRCPFTVDGVAASLIFTFPVTMGVCVPPDWPFVELSKVLSAASFAVLDFVAESKVIFCETVESTALDSAICAWDVTTCATFCCLVVKWGRVVTIIGGCDFAEWSEWEVVAGILLGAELVNLDAKVVSTDAVVALSNFFGVVDVAAIGAVDGIAIKK